MPYELLGNKEAAGIGWSKEVAMFAPCYVSLPSFFFFDCHEKPPLRKVKSKGGRCRIGMRKVLANLCIFWSRGYLALSLIVPRFIWWPSTRLYETSHTIVVAVLVRNKCLLPGRNESCFTWKMISLFFCASTAPTHVPGFLVNEVKSKKSSVCVASTVNLLHTRQCSIKSHHSYGVSTWSYNLLRPSIWLIYSVCKLCECVLWCLSLFRQQRKCSGLRQILLRSLQFQETDSALAWTQQRLYCSYVENLLSHQKWTFWHSNT